jgi:hypothetical protein
MRFWTRNLGRGLLCTCFGPILAHAALAANDAPAIAANDAARCLSLQEVHGGYPRYRLIGGRKCWYASTRGPEAKPTEARPAEVDVNPYDDPIWHEPEITNASAAASRAKNCEEQALKLDLKEKRAFMKQCMAN